MHVRGTHVSVRVYAGGVGVGHPVQRRDVQDGLQRGGLVAPFEVLLPDPAGQRRRIPPCLHALPRRFALRRVGTLCTTYQDNSDTGLHPTTIPIVDGLVPCSNAYANRWYAPRTCATLGPASSPWASASGVPFGGDSMCRKLRWRAVCQPRRSLL